MQVSRFQKLTKDAEVTRRKVRVGSYVVRMDQPYSRMADMLLDTPYYNVNDPRPYDDTGWTLGHCEMLKTFASRMKDLGCTDGDDRRTARLSHRLREMGARGRGKPHR
jgi:hypothetical protein